jgi:universal stress protein A
MRILLAIDKSKYSEAAVRSVTSFFKPQNIEVTILHVLPPIVLSAPPQMSRGYAPELEGERKEAQTFVDKYAQQLRREGFTVDCVVETGDVRETILDSAASRQADLILLGSHGHKGMSRLLLGSVAESVVRHANSSVLVARLPGNK